MLLVFLVESVRLLLRLVAAPTPATEPPALLRRLVRELWIGFNGFLASEGEILFKQVGVARVCLPNATVCVRACVYE